MIFIKSPCDLAMYICCSVVDKSIMSLRLGALLSFIWWTGDAFSPSRSPVFFPRAISGDPAQKSHPNKVAYILLHSTPFDVSLYDSDDEEDEDIMSSKGDPLSSAFRELALSPETKIVVGVNKYSHDTSLCAADYSTGRVLFALSKERLSRRKFDGGNIASLVETCLDNLQLDVDSIVKVVMNNHHHRILPLESNYDHLLWEEGLQINGGGEDGYTDEFNLLNSIPDKIELSHHLAHAYSVASQCPENSGLIVVMDGMGETYRTMKTALDAKDDTYVSDLAFEGQFDCIPSDIHQRAMSSIFDWREGESAYVYSKGENGLSVKPIFKRFIEERTPPTIYNHGFENMDSMGAVYSRASSHIFGDWNACGKIMGLAPWHEYTWTYYDKDKGEDVTLRVNSIDQPIMGGKLYSEGEDGFFINRSALVGVPIISRNDPDLFDDDGNMVRKNRYDFDGTVTAGDSDDDKSDGLRLPTKAAQDAISLAYRVQKDLETVALDFVKYCKGKSQAKNLCLAGGVALNSVLNGRLSRELGFESVFIPPYPGDDGISIGCCAYALYGNAALQYQVSSNIPPVWSKPLSPYLGPSYSDYDMREAIEQAAPWLDVETMANEDERLNMMMKEIESGGIIAWFQGRSEMGPRALGHRSILADPREGRLVRFINEKVKSRETFRPFAPSVLTEEAEKWFELGESGVNTSNISPYMSMTTSVKSSKRSLIPAVTHVDGSSRLQTVSEESDPLYYKLIKLFYKKTGVPMVLNTSFNTLKSEPIVETPKEAIRSFLCSKNSIEFLVMGKYVLKRKDACIRRLLGEGQKGKYNLLPSFPKRAGPVEYETKFTIGKKSSDTEIVPKTRIRMPDRPMHNEMSDDWFPLLDEFEGELLGLCDGTMGVNDMVSQFLPDSEDEDNEVDDEYRENVLGNILQRLVRLYEYTFISW